MNAKCETTTPLMYERDFDMIRQIELPCRCCGKPVEMKWQKSYKGDEAGYIIVTCWNPDCTPREGGLYTVTRELHAWLGAEIAKQWGIKELPGWKLPDGLQSILSYIERRNSR